MRLRSYGELEVLRGIQSRRGRGLGALDTGLGTDEQADSSSAEAIFGKIIGGLADVAKVVVPAVVPTGSSTGSSTVDDLLKKLTSGDALKTTAAPAPSTAGGISTNTILIGGGIALLAVLLMRRR